MTVASESKLITAEDAGWALVEVVRRDPDRQQTMCSYVRAGVACCIVGAALAELGVPVAVLAAMDKLEKSIGSEIDVPEVWDLLDAHGWSLSPRAQKVFRAAQVRADRGLCWSDALMAEEDGAMP